MTSRDRPGPHATKRAVLLTDRDRDRRLRARRRNQSTGRSWLGRLRAMLGLPRTIVVDGVRYREWTTVPLRRALTPAGGGVKEYEVIFAKPADHDRPVRATMRIRVTPDRLYADLGPSRRLPMYRRLAGRIRPGQRVLEVGCGTGAGSAWLAQQVGPSGGLVALDRDGESIRYARQRYPIDHCGFELGGLETLHAELDGAFDAVLAVDPVTADPSGADKALAELWRVVAPGGLLFICDLPERSPAHRSDAPDASDLRDRLSKVCGPSGEIEFLSGPGDESIAVVASRLTEPDDLLDDGPPWPG